MNEKQSATPGICSDPNVVAWRPVGERQIEVVKEKVIGQMKMERLGD